MTTGIAGNEDPSSVSWAHVYSQCMAVALASIIIPFAIGRIFGIPAAILAWMPLLAVLGLAYSRAAGLPAWTVLFGVAISVGAYWLTDGWGLVSQAREVVALDNITALYTATTLTGLALAPMALWLIDPHELPRDRGARVWAPVVILVEASAPIGAASLWGGIWQWPMCFQAPLFAAVVATLVVLGRRIGSPRAVLALLAAIVVIALGLGLVPRIWVLLALALAAGWVGVVIARRARLGPWRVIMALVLPTSAVYFMQGGLPYLVEWVLLHVVYR